MECYQWFEYNGAWWVFFEDYFWQWGQMLSAKSIPKPCFEGPAGPQEFPPRQLGGQQPELSKPRSVEGRTLVVFCLGGWVKLLPLSFFDRPGSWRRSTRRTTRTTTTTRRTTTSTRRTRASRLRQPGSQNFFKFQNSTPNKTISQRRTPRSAASSEPGLELQLDGFLKARKLVIGGLSQSFGWGWPWRFLGWGFVASKFGLGDGSGGPKGVASKLGLGMFLEVPKGGPCCLNLGWGFWRFPEGALLPQSLGWG